ncbi:hypothetical protein MIMGU_mgv1a0266071mg, partial [Erythranthe guttata]
MVDGNVTLVIVILLSLTSIEAFGTFGFDIHHRYSDTVKQFLNVDGLPEKGTVHYYAAMAHRDQLFKGRRHRLHPHPHFLWWQRDLPHHESFANPQFTFDIKTCIKFQERLTLCSAMS